MNIGVVMATLAGLAAAAVAAVGAQQPAAVSFLVETEDFQFKGEWLEERDPAASGRGLLRTPGAVADALTVVNLPHAAAWLVWVRARDYTALQGKRRFKLAIDGEEFEPEFGAHGTEGWKWEKAGRRELAAGRHVLALRDTARFFGRADAILLTSGDSDPNTSASPGAGARRLIPDPVRAEPAAPFAPVPALGAGEPCVVAALENERIRLRFVARPDAGGRSLILRETELRVGESWRRLAVAGEAEKLFLLQAAKVDLRHDTMLPSWISEPASAPLYRFTLGGRSYEAMAGRANPFFAAPGQALIGREARQAGNRMVEVDYETPGGLRATGRWVLEPRACDVAFSLEFVAPADGFYSAGFSAFQGWSPEQVRFNLLPPLFQFQRQPESPVMVPSNSTPQPLALVQTGEGGETVALGVAADPARLPFVWADARNSVYGFSLLNACGAAQPTIFAPVLGQDSSRMKQGEKQTVSWRVLAFPGDWKGALEYASNEIFRVTDYRKPHAASLTDAALNMIDLIRDEQAAGWNPERKGFWNIETTNVASQAAPLAVVAAAVLSRDEELYRSRALPTIEYTLSRPQAHFGMEVPATHAAYINEEGTRMRVPSDFYGTAYWQGLHDLLGRKNPWLGEIAMPEGRLRHRTAYSALPRWSEMMGAYRLNPAPGLLAEIEAEAARFLANEVYGRKTRDLGLQPFYNVSFYPYWWDLLDLYELTHDRKYLDAAEESAFFTIAGLWSHPRVPDGDVTIHPGGEYVGETHSWWKGDQIYRLGNPRAPGATPEKKVPAWLVAQVGLGLEQPCTYYTTKGGMRKILMSAWAPNLLRLYRHTGREIYRIYARNSVLSRYGNYPGYYLSGYTDVHLQPDYPRRGPDVTSIYYHHIPPHLAFTIDFLVTEAEQRSQGRITFPWVKQQGYVWFSNRIYGHAPGSVFGDGSARLWLDRRNVRVPEPAVNWLLARGTSRIWLVLMNESGKGTTAPVELNRAALGLQGGSFTLFQADGSSTTGALTDRLSIPLPPQGLVALSFPAPAEERAPVLAMQGGRASLPLPGDWGVLQAFRIRSPFGRDSLFAVLTGRPRPGGAATLVLEGAEPLARKSYPYEFSVYPWPMDRDLRFTLRLEDGAGGRIETAPVTLPGTR